MTVSSVGKKLVETYLTIVAASHLLETYGGRSLRDRLLLKVLRSLARDFEDYLSRRTPLRMLLFIVKTFPKAILLRLLLVGGA